MRALWIAVAVFMAGALGVSATPVSDGSLFTDDFAVDISQWLVTGGPGTMAYDGVLGTPAGSIRMESDAASEVNARTVTADSTGYTEWVAEFDFRLDSGSDAGTWTLIYAGYGPAVLGSLGSPVDVEVGIDSTTVQTSASPWDFHIYDAGGSTVVDANLAWDTWHHFAVHRTSEALGTVEVWVNGVQVPGTFTSTNIGTLIGTVQIGDPGGVQYGHANWDNISIGGVIPEPSSLALIVLAGLLVAGLKSRRS